MDVYDFRSFSMVLAYFFFLFIIEKQKKNIYNINHDFTYQ